MGVLKLAVQRRDSKGRNLRIGESQRKNGLYVYKYNVNGKPKFLYSWKLVPTDKTPAGKRDDLSLREKEQALHHDLHDGILPGKKLTVYELCEKKHGLCSDISASTEDGRNAFMVILQKDILGSRPIDKVKRSDAQEWAIRMQKMGYSFGTIAHHKRSLSAAFHMAVEDDCIRKNPFEFSLKTIIKDDTQEKEPLSLIQEQALFAFVQQDKTYQKYYDELVVLIDTGLRISEFCGLTEKDLDFENRLIDIDHQLLRNAKKGYYIAPPKTEHGYRTIYMTDRVYTALQRILSRRPQSNFTVEGYRDFLFLNSSREPQTRSNYKQMFKRLAIKYAKYNRIPLPASFSPHILRHTFCTKMANAGMNPKTLQYIMGHSSVITTLKYYTHASMESAKEEMRRIQQKHQVKPLVA